MNNRRTILKSELFILGLGILLLNDFYLKAEFSNWFTGKLSDVAGLFIFPLFLTALFPGNKKICFLSTTLVFFWWKSSWSDPVILALNNIGLEVARVVDYSDLWILLVLPAAYYYESRQYKTLQISPVFILLIALFAFSATTLAPRRKQKYIINRTYGFNYSKAELVGRINRITIKNLKQLSVWHKMNYDAANDIFYSRINGDTLAQLLDVKKLNDKDTIKFKTVLADFLISGNDSISKLHLLHAYKIIPVASDKDYREKVIREFEKRVVKELKKKN